MQSVYNIINRFTVDDQATRAMNRMAASVAGLNSAIYQTRSALGSLLTMGAVFTGAYALVGLKRALYDYNSELENSEIAFGAIFNAGMNFPTPDGSVLDGWAKFNNAIGLGQKLVVDFQQDAALSVGTTKDFVDIAKQIASPLLNMGKNITDLREFTNLTVAAASVLGVDFPQASRDMMSSLTGTAGIDVKLFRLLNIKGGAKEFNALAPTERFDILTKEMSKYKIAAEAFALSNKGLTSTLSDLSTIFLGKAGRHPMETWKQALKDILEYANSSKETLDRLNNSLGEGMSKGLQGIVNSTKFLINNKEALLTLGSAFLGYKALGLLSGMSTIGFGRRVARNSAVAVGRYGPGLMKFPMLSMMNGIGAMDGTLKTFTKFPLLVTKAFGSSALAGASRFLLMIARLASYLTIAGVVVLFFAGIINALRTNFNGATTHIMNAMNRLIGVIMRLAGGAGSPLGKLFSWLMDLATLIGAHVIHTIAILIEAIAALAETAIRAGNAISAGWKEMSSATTADVVMGKTNILGKMAEGWKNTAGFDTGTDYMGKLWEGWKKWEPLSSIPGNTNEDPDANVPQNNTTINGGVHIYQEFKENHEPDRIAFATVNLLNRLAINPVQPRRSISLGGAS